MSTDYALSDLERRMANMIRAGKVTEVDLDAKRAKVDLGDDDPTDWLPWCVAKAGKDRRWQAPDVGEQVVVFSPGGEFGQGFIGGSLFQDDFPANGDEATASRTTFDDGSVIEYDRESHALNLSLHDDAVLTITIAGMTIQVTKDLAKLGENANNFVALANLVKQELDALRTAFNSFVSGPYSSHTHPYVDTPAGAAVTSPTLSSGTPANPINEVAAAKVKAE